MNARQTATILAALRYWQFHLTGESPGDDFADIARNNGRVVPLTADEIDDLCRLVDPSPLIPRHPTDRHSAEPWQVDEDGWRVIIPRSRPEYCDEVIFDIAEGLDEADNAAHLANARRIVACVNACAGVPTRLLQHAQTIEVTGMDPDGDAFTFHRGQPGGRLPRFDPYGEVPIPPSAEDAR